MWESAARRPQERLPHVWTAVTARRTEGIVPQDRVPSQGAEEFTANSSRALIVISSFASLRELSLVFARPSARFPFPRDHDAAAFRERQALHALESCLFKPSPAVALGLGTSLVEGIYEEQRKRMSATPSISGITRIAHW